MRQRRSFCNPSPNFGALPLLLFPPCRGALLRNLACDDPATSVNRMRVLSIHPPREPAFLNESSAMIASNPQTRSNSVRAVLLIILVTTVVRFAIAAAVGLSVDESYTVAISRQLALSYYDHPPLHLWLVGTWAKLVGHEDPWIVRAPFIVLFAGTTWMMFRLTASAFGDRAGFWAALALNLAPLFTIGTASWVLPDGPLVFFSLLAVWLSIQALSESLPAHAVLLTWVAAGAAAGLALLSKYLAIFPLLGFGLFLLTPRFRRELAGPAPWLALLVAGMSFTPVVVWNAAHGWASFTFQGSRALAHQLSLVRWAQDIAGQSAYLLPWTIAALTYALVRALRRGPGERWRWLFACLSLVPIVFFALAGLWTTVLPHWPAIGWLFAFPLLGFEFARVERNGARWPMKVAPLAAAALILLVTLTVSQAMTGWMQGSVPGVPVDDPTTDVLDWTELRHALASRHLLRRGVVVATVSWIDAGKADYALRGETPVLCLSSDPRQFAFLRDVRRFRGSQAIIVANAARADWRQLAQPHFQQIDSLPDVELTRQGRPALTLRIAWGVGLKTE